MMSLYRAMSLLLAALCICAADPGPPQKPDQERIRGTWQFVKMVSEGKEQEIPEGFRLVITADSMVTGKEDREGKGKDEERDRTAFKYTIDPGKSPRQMDWIIEIDPASPIRQMAIYSLENDTLKICSESAGRPRPGEFESRKGDTRTLWILKRMTDDQKQAR
jgi:uncharacterized protein (TIGR03067 family)